MRLAWALALLVLLPASSLAQPPPPVSVEIGPDDFSTDPSQAADQRARKAGVYDLRVRYVTIDARWAKGVTLPLAAGDPLTPQTISAALEALKQRIDDNALHGYGLRTKGELGILHIDVEYDTSPSPGDPPDGPRTVGVIFHPYYVRFLLERVGDNVLPIPRSPHPTFYDNVPAPLLALNPSFGVFSDRAFGTALGGSVNGDLLNLFAPGRVDPAVSPRHLEAHAQGLKAVDEPFYRAAAGQAKARLIFAEASNQRPRRHREQARRRRAGIEELRRGVASEEARVRRHVAPRGAATRQHLEPDRLSGRNRDLLAVAQARGQALIRPAAVQPAVVLPHGDAAEAVDARGDRVEEHAVELLLRPRPRAQLRRGGLHAVVRPPQAGIERQPGVRRHLEQEADAAER